MIFRWSLTALVISAASVFTLAISDNLAFGVPKTILNLTADSESHALLKTRYRTSNPENSDLREPKYSSLAIDLERLPVVVIHPDIDAASAGAHASRVRENIIEVLSPFLLTMREEGVPIFFTPAATGRGSHPVLEMSDDEAIMHLRSKRLKQSVFYNYLAMSGINTVLVAGYDLNSCVYENAISIRGLGLAGFEAVLVRDATVAIEYFGGHRVL